MLPPGVRQDRLDKILVTAAARAEHNFFDESDVPYEAARLDHEPVVLVLYFEGADFARRDFSRASIHFFIAKGDAEFLQYWRGETQEIKFEAVFALNPRAAAALRAALHRRVEPPRLVVSDLQ
jgi:hypothetical protein